MSRFTVAVLTDENTTVDKLLEPFGINGNVQRTVLRTKRRIIADEYMKICDHIQIMKRKRNYMEKTKACIEEINDIDNSISYLENVLNKGDEEIYKLAIKKYNKELINEDGSLAEYSNPHCKWLYYNKNSEYTKFIVIENPDKPGEYIYTNVAKIKDIKWKLLDHKAIFTDATIYPDGTWYDHRLKYILKYKENEKQEKEYELSDSKNAITKMDDVWQITIVECYD